MRYSLCTTATWEPVQAALYGQDGWTSGIWPHCVLLCVSALLCNHSIAVYPHQYWPWTMQVLEGMSIPVDLADRAALIKAANT